MRVLRHLPMLLMTVAMLWLLATSVHMIVFIQSEPPPGELLTVRWRWDLFVQEAGYGRATLGLLGLLVVFIPFRRGEVWSWFALLGILLAYMLPVHVLRVLSPFPGWHVFWRGFFEAGAPRVGLEPLLVTAFMIVGLGSAFPRLVREIARRYRNKR